MPLLPRRIDFIDEYTCITQLPTLCALPSLQTAGSFATRGQQTGNNGFGGSFGPAGASSGMPGGYGGMGSFGQSATSSLTDPQRMWDLGNLQSKLNDMAFAVASADEALQMQKEPFDGGMAFDGSTGGAGGGLGGDMGQGQPGSEGVSTMAFGFDLTTLPTDEGGNYLPVDPVSMIDLEVLPIKEGFLHKKSESGLLRGWKQRFARLEGAELAFYDRPDDRKPKSRFGLDAKSSVELGDTVKSGGGSGGGGGKGGVKFDLVLVNGRGARVWIYLESENEAGGWMQSLHYVITRLQEGERLNDLIASGALPPLAEIAQAQAQQQAAAQRGGRNGATGAGGASIIGDGGGDGGSTAGVGELLGLADASGGGSGGSSGTPALLAGPEVQRAIEAALCHTAHGPGLFDAVRGEPASFFIQAHDAPGVPRPVGGDIFSVSLDSDDLHFELVPVDNGDGTYTVDYTPTRSGSYELRVTYEGHDIAGSPFYPTVSKAPTAASHCMAAGEGMTVARVGAGAVNEFTITARDQFDDPRETGGDSFEVTIIGPGLANPIVDQGDGTYTVSYDVDETAPGYIKARDEGRALSLEVHIVLNNEGFPYPRPIAGSPFRPRIAMPGSPAAAAFTAPPSGGANVTSAAGGLPSPGGFASAASPSATASAVTPTTTSGGAMDPAAAAALAAKEAAIAAARAELEAKERSLAESLAAVEAMRRALEEDRANVDRQMMVMAELGKKVKEDSERLAEQARALRAVAVTQANAVPVPPQQQQQFSATTATLRPSSSTGASLSPVAGNWSPEPAQQQQKGRQSLTGSLPGAGSNINQLLFSDTASIATAGTTGTAAAAMAAALAQAQQQQQNEMSSSSGGELFEPDVMALFDRYRKPLYALFQHYAAATATAAMSGGDVAADQNDAVTSQLAASGSMVDAKRFAALFVDYDVAPTFMTRKELKTIFTSTAAAHAASDVTGGTSASLLTYAGFIEALGRSALTALSKPAFVHIYPSARDKVGVLLEMWRLGDPSKLAEVVRRPKSAGEGGAGAGVGQKAAKRRV